MSINSRQKGAAGERELCHELKGLFGWQAERSQQHCGNAGDSDVRIRELPSVFAEVKRVQRLNVQEAMAKAVEQSQGQTPMLFHRVNRGPWLCTINLSQLQEVSRLVMSASLPMEPSGPSSTDATT